MAHVPTAPHAHTHTHAADYGSHGHGDHGHVIVPLITLRLVLGALLFFTLLTVGLAQAERIAAEVFNFTVPQWANVFVALSIATVKTVLVVLFFMQLKYDNPLNSMIFIFTIITVVFFLGFTILDIGNRGTIDRFKGRYILEGGTGLSGGGPITQTSRDAAIAAGDYHAHHDHHGDHSGIISEAGYRDRLPESGSSQERSRPVRGLTLPGFAKPEGGHGHGHADEAGHAAPAEKPPADH